MTGKPASRRESESQSNWARRSSSRCSDAPRLAAAASGDVRAGRRDRAARRPRLHRHRHQARREESRFVVAPASRLRFPRKLRPLSARATATRAMVTRVVHLRLGSFKVPRPPRLQHHAHRSRDSLQISFRSADENCALLLQCFLYRPLVRAELARASGRFASPNMAPSLANDLLKSYILLQQLTYHRLEGFLQNDQRRGVWGLAPHENDLLYGPAELSLVPGGISL